MLPTTIADNTSWDGKHARQRLGVGVGVWSGVGVVVRAPTILVGYVQAARDFLSGKEMPRVCPDRDANLQPLIRRVGGSGAGDSMRSESAKSKVSRIAGAVLKNRSLFGTRQTNDGNASKCYTSLRTGTVCNEDWIYCFVLALYRSTE